MDDDELHCSSLFDRRVRDMMLISRRLAALRQASRQSAGGGRGGRACARGEPLGCRDRWAHAWAARHTAWVGGGGRFAARVCPASKAREAASWWAAGSG